MIKNRRVLIKLSGEGLNLVRQNDKNIFLDIIDTLKNLQLLGVEIVLVIGGGNIFRGLEAKSLKIDRPVADNIGMLATMINGLYFQQILLNAGINNEVLSAINCEKIVKLYTPEKARKYLEQKKIVICVGGVNNPYFTTDTAAAIRALETNCHELIKGTKVGGVYDKDPVKYSNAVKFDKISYQEYLNKNLKVMDTSAVALCQNQQLPIRIFDIFALDALKQAVLEQNIGSLISGE